MAAHCIVLAKPDAMEDDHGHNGHHDVAPWGADKLGLRLQERQTHTLDVSWLVPFFCTGIAHRQVEADRSVFCAAHRAAVSDVMREILKRACCERDAIKSARTQSRCAGHVVESTFAES